MIFSRDFYLGVPLTKAAVTMGCNYNKNYIQNWMLTSVWMGGCTRWLI